MVSTAPESRALGCRRLLSDRFAARQTPRNPARTLLAGIDPLSRRTQLIVDLIIRRRRAFARRYCPHVHAASRAHAHVGRIVSPGVARGASLGAGRHPLTLARNPRFADRHRTATDSSTQALPRPLAERLRVAPVAARSCMVRERVAIGEYGGHVNIPKAFRRLWRHHTLNVVQELLVVLLSHLGCVDTKAADVDHNGASALRTLGADASDPRVLRSAICPGTAADASAPRVRSDATTETPTPRARIGATARAARAGSTAARAAAFASAPDPAVCTALLSTFAGAGPDAGAGGAGLTCLAVPAAARFVTTAASDEEGAQRDQCPHESSKADSMFHGVTSESKPISGFAKRWRSRPPRNQRSRCRSFVGEPHRTSPCRASTRRNSIARGLHVAPAGAAGAQPGFGGGRPPAAS